MSEIKHDLFERLHESVLSEIDSVDTEHELAGGNDRFLIAPTIIIDEGSMPTAVYGIYNRETNIRETEARQYSAAKMWVEALTEKALACEAGELPGLGADPDPTGSRMH